MDIQYKVEDRPGIERAIELYNLAGLPRPIKDKHRMNKMFEFSNLIISAWHETQLVGISRSITDWVWSCYLADLAVHPDFQRLGIGKKLIELTKEAVGKDCMVLLLSVPTAMEYYPKMGFVKQESSFIINREPWN